MKLQQKGLKIHTPAGPEEFKQIFSDFPEADLLAGGTDLIRQLQEREAGGNILIDLSRLRNELTGITRTDDSLIIGSLTRFSELGESEDIGELMPALYQAAREMGSAQIRNLATLGGNIANASPAADSIPPLLAHEAELKVINPGGIKQKITLNDYLDDERRGLITEIIIPVIDPVTTFSYFQKIGSRHSVTIARLNAGVRIKYQPQQRYIEEARIILGALGLRAFSARKPEEVLSGVRFGKNNHGTEKLKNKLLAALTETVDEAIPGRYSQPYKRMAVRGLGADIFSALKEELIHE